MKIIHCMLMLAYCWLSTRCGLCMYNIFHNEHVYNGDIFYMLLITRQKSTGAGWFKYYLSMSGIACYTSLQLLFQVDGKNEEAY